MAGFHRQNNKTKQNPLKLKPDELTNELCVRHVRPHSRTAGGARESASKRPWPEMRDQMFVRVAAGASLQHKETDSRINLSSSNIWHSLLATKSNN